jgi:hypothetical protein
MILHVAKDGTIDLLGRQTSDLSSSVVGTHDSLNSSVADSKPREVGSTARLNRSGSVGNNLGVTSLGSAEVDKVVVDVGDDAGVAVQED